MSAAAAAAVEHGEPVIQVENLVTHYGERQILNGVSLTVNEGEVLVIMGGSGSGKSTLLRYMLALERPTSGTIRILGQDLTTATRCRCTSCARRWAWPSSSAPCSAP